MSQELDSTDFEAVISHYNIGSLDRQQEIWDRAMPKAMTDQMFATFVHNAGLGPHPGKYTGPQPDFEKALLEKAILIANDPTPCIFPIVCPTHDVSRALLLERLFRLTDHAHFRNGVDAGR